MIGLLCEHARRAAETAQTGPEILLPAAALLLGSGLLTAVILRRR